MNDSCEFLTFGGDCLYILSVLCRCKFAGKQAVVEKIYLLNVLEPVSAARAAERSICSQGHAAKKGGDCSTLSGVIKDHAGERSVGGASVFDLNEDRLGDRAAFVAETFALWGQHLAFLHELQRTSLPQRKLILLVAYMEDIIGTLVRGFFLDKFQVGLPGMILANPASFQCSLAVVPCSAVNSASKV